MVNAEGYLFDKELLSKMIFYLADVSKVDHC